MGRTRRQPPSRQQLRSGSFRAPLKSWNAAPVRHKQHSTDFTCRRCCPTHPFNGGARTPSPKRHAKTFRPSISHSNFSPDLNDDTCFEETLHDIDGDESENNSDSGDDSFCWEDEETLFSDLMEEAAGDSEEHLVNRLQPSFDLYGRDLKREVAETFVPTVKRVKELYKVLDGKVDMTFSKGLLIFNKACKDMEFMSIQESDELKDTWSSAQKNIDGLFDQLKEAYIRREQLWFEFDKAIDEIAGPTLESLKTAPGRLERTIASLEKHARDVDKDESGMASAAEKKVKGLLNKLS